MGAEEDLIDLTSETSDSIVEVDGQVWNAARLEQLMKSQDLQTPYKRLIIRGHVFGGHKYKQRSTTFFSTKRASKRSAVFASKSDLRAKLQRNLQANLKFNLRTNPSASSSDKESTPLANRFYLDAFAMETDIMGRSRFKSWNMRPRGSMRCIAELDNRGLTISFSYTGRYELKPMSSWWFPKIDGHNGYRIYYDHETCSLKFRWNAGRTLYVQLCPSHYRSLCRALRMWHSSNPLFQEADQVRSLGA